MTLTFTFMCFECGPVLIQERLKLRSDDETATSVTSCPIHGTQYNLCSKYGEASDSRSRVVKEFNLSRRQDYGQTQSTHDPMKPGARVDMYFVKCLIDCRGQKVETVEPTCTWTLCSELRRIRIANGKACYRSYLESLMLMSLRCSVSNLLCVELALLE
jgi:hypothetical protein